VLFGFAQLSRSGLALGSRRGSLCWDHRCGGGRNSLGRGRGRDLEFDLDCLAGFGFRELQYLAEEAVPNSIAM
jgi:hypothetical protein